MDVWLPILQTIVGGVLAGGGAIIALHLGKNRDLRDEHHRWARQLKTDKYTTLMRAAQELHAEERLLASMRLAVVGEQLSEYERSLVAGEITDDRLVAARSRCISAHNKVSDATMEAMLVASLPVQLKLSSLLGPERAMRSLALEDGASVSRDTFENELDRLTRQRIELLKVLREDLKLDYGTPEELRKLVTESQSAD
jgi:hypothetical protein